MQTRLNDSGDHDEIHQAETSFLQPDGVPVRQDVTILKHNVGILDKHVLMLRQDVQALKHDVAALIKNVSALEKDASSLQRDMGIIKSNYVTKEDNLRLDLKMEGIRVELYNSLSIQTTKLAVWMFVLSGIGLILAKILF